jgi:hypothetical protein
MHATLIGPIADEGNLPTLDGICRPSVCGRRCARVRLYLTPCPIFRLVSLTLALGR